MKCRNCKTKITKENKQTYKFGLQLPYCKHCTNAYNNKETTIKKALTSKEAKQAAKKIRKMTPKKRRSHYEELIKKHGKKAVDQTWKEMNIPTE